MADNLNLIKNVLLTTSSTNGQKNNDMPISDSDQRKIKISLNCSI